MVKRLQDILDKDSFVAVGLMSGTSMDGIDAALVEMPAGEDLSRLELVTFVTVPYPDELKSSLRDIAFGEQCTAEDIAVMHTSVATAFAGAFHSVCRQAGVETVDFIGSHGQTVAHVPPRGDGMTLIAGTLQMGPPGMIAALTGVTTIGDFRAADIALGGQGAPLAPYVDFLLRRSKTQDRIILNIGGIANLTYLPKNCSLGEVIAFDTGPGNMIVDELYRVLYPKEGSYEKLSELVAEGKPSQSLVDTFLGLTFFEHTPPKSAGHHEFGGRFAWEFLSKAEAEGLKREDILASAVSLTTRSIDAALRDFVRPAGDIDEVLVTGGGSRNPTMLSELRAWLDPVVVDTIEKLGVPPEAKEAVDFAVLARETLLAHRNVIHVATGASRAAILGTIALGS
ncbi:MAG: anhydro-N-acetylmuramic acid kinase [Candidatus Krumholzibacteria bacterium]|nr:anhydro-N-acetylmuramic acid kinase [Candidatus Krumholzibacteria bacterium]